MFDFDTLPLLDRAFSRAPMAFLDPEPKNTLLGILDVIALETASRADRESWQDAQVQNLLKHAAERSAVWRQRIGRARSLRQLPVLTRHEVRQQVEAEGPLLLPSDGMPTDDHATSGSSGVPVRFFVSEFNARYNEIRTLAQYFVEGREFAFNRTRLKQTVYLNEGISVDRDESWAGSLSPFLASGASKTISLSAFAADRDVGRKLVEELETSDIGYLICNPKHLEVIATIADLEVLKAANLRMWIPYGEHVSGSLVETFSRLGIPVRANYSTEEVGLIGVECARYRGCYHVVTSNVVVEIGGPMYDIDGTQVGRVLITHLHAYATPFVRYEIGDLASLASRCQCGHDGPMLFNLQGRSNRILKHPDGRLSAFHVTGVDLARVVDFSEYRIRQTALDKIIVEIGGRARLSEQQSAAVTNFIRERAGEAFSIEVIASPRIDWGPSQKKPGFRCDI